VVVRNAAVFAAKFGAGLPVAGEFTGGLDNGGERLVLSLGGATPLRDFTYDNNLPWPPEADNGGASLVLVAPHTNPDHANPLNWRASSVPSPNATDATSFAAWKSAHGQPDDNADTDGDGLSAFAEYSLGGNPNVASLSPLPTLTRQPDGSAILRFSRPLTADDSARELQSGDDLSGWTPAPATLVSRSVAGGVESFTFSIPDSEFAGLRRFWRLRLWLR
jgi:hypothetical protein